MSTDHLLRNLHRAIVGSHASTDELLDSVLAAGQEILGLPVAIVSRIEGDLYTIRAVRSEDDDFAAGDRFPVSATCCSQVVERNELVSFVRGGEGEEGITHPIYDETGVGAYISVPVWAEGEIYGTLNFSGPKADRRKFLPEERAAVEILAEHVGHYLLLDHEGEARRSAQEALELSEAKFKRLVENTLVGFVIIQDGRLQYANPRMAEIFGYSVEEIVGFDSVTRIVHLEDRPTVRGNIRRRIEGEVDELHYSFRGVRKDGRTIYVEVHGVSVNFEGRPAVMGTLLDVTDRVEASAALQKSEERFRRLVQEVQDYAIFLLDEEGKVASWSHGGMRLTGYDEDSVVGEPFCALFLPDGEVDVDALLEEARSGGRADVECWQQRKNGTAFWASVAITPIWGEERETIGYTVVTHDLTEQRAHEETLRFKAEHDALTGLPNRRYFFEAAEQAIEQQMEEGRSYALLYFDMDRFKWVNDTLGHQAGDQLLRQVAMRLVESVRGTDTVARLGGDEFVVLVRDYGSRTELEGLARRIVQTIRKPYRIDEETVYPSASIGIVEGEARYQQTEELLRDADAAMYRSKRSPHRDSVFYTDEVEAHFVTSFHRERELREALEQDQLEVHYQPIVEFAGDRLVAFEALVRWRHPKEGLLRPGAFIEVAEEVGLLREIDRWMLQAACRQVQQWSEEAGKEPRLLINVNCSNDSLLQPGFSSHVEEALEETGIPPAQVVLEITEQLLLKDARRVAAEFEALKRLGVRLCLDDFGTDRSSFWMLQHLPLDALKIDRAFIRELTAEGRERAIIEAIVSLASAFDLQVVAEGVEEDHQREVLRAAGCDYGQGYLFGRPMDADAAAALLHDVNRPGGF